MLNSPLHRRRHHPARLPHLHRVARWGLPLAALSVLAGCSSPLPPDLVPAASLAEPLKLAPQPTANRNSPAALAPEPAQPEAASGWMAKPAVRFARTAVATANPLASQAGLQMLEAGGSALDAAIAAQMVLALVEPQSSGIGGGAFLLHWDGQAVQAWDGRETAPAAATPELFLGAQGKPLAFAQAQASGKAVGVPGVLRMLEAAHRQHGRLPWAQLFQPAIALAENGFALSPRLHSLLKVANPTQADAQARAYFYQTASVEEGSFQPWPIGHLLKNPALAAVFKRLATEGSAALHQGTVAEDVVRRVQTHPSRPGSLALADLAGYQPVQRPALCSLWRQVYRVCGFPPPSSGHLAMMQILGILDALPPLAEPALPVPEGQPPGTVEPQPGAAWLHRYAQASRLAFADRAMFVADPAFTPAPGGDWRSLLAPAYVQERASLVTERDAGAATAGAPPAWPPSSSASADAPNGSSASAHPPQTPAQTPAPTRLSWAPQPEQPEYGTSHISVVDAQGRALAMTTTVEAAFGTGLMSDGGTGLPGGFLLNNQLTDFSFTPQDAQGRPVANRVEPGKRPRSSMSPTLVFDARNGQLLMSLGSPGGAAIIHYTAKTLLGTLAWGLGPQQAVELPNFAHYNGAALVLEEGRFDAATLAALRERGYTVQEQALTSGLQVLQRQVLSAETSVWLGGADPRREGLVLGQ